MADRVDARVRVSCAHCGTIEVPAAEVHLVMGRPETAGDPPRDEVEFRCGTCGLGGSTRVDERAARLVARAGAPVAGPPAPRAAPPARGRRRPR